MHVCVHVRVHVCVCKYEYPACTRLHMYIVKMFPTGWLTLGPELSSSNYNKEKYIEFFVDHPVIPNTDDIETLRPKSPPPKGAGRGRGRGMGGGSSMTRTPGMGGGYM